MMKTLETKVYNNNFSLIENLINLKTFVEFVDCLAKVPSIIHVFALGASNMFTRIVYFNGSNTAKRMSVNFATINSHFVHSIGPICQNDSQFGICFEVVLNLFIFTIYPYKYVKGVFLIMARFMRLTLTYTLVVTCWLGLVPLMAARTHRLVFSGLLSSFFSSRILQLFSTENVAIDIARGSLVLTLFLCTFISLVWLREQIMVNHL